MLVVGGWRNVNEQSTAAVARKSGAHHHQHGCVTTALLCGVIVSDLTRTVAHQNGYYVRVSASFLLADCLFGFLVLLAVGKENLRRPTCKSMRSTSATSARLPTQTADKKAIKLTSTYTPLVGGCNDNRPTERAAIQSTRSR